MSGERKYGLNEGAWKARFVHAMMAAGIDFENAQTCADAGWTMADPSFDPEGAAADELSYWREEAE